MSNELPSAEECAQRALNILDRTGHNRPGTEYELQRAQVWATLATVPRTQSMQVHYTAVKGAK